MITSAELHEEARRWLLLGGGYAYEGNDVLVSEFPQYSNFVPERFCLRLDLNR
jgi:hypothetical protein